MSQFNFQYPRPREQVRSVNPDIRQYFDSDLPIYGPWKPWQTKPELPSSEEILGTDVPGDIIALSPNRISGPWVSKEEYLEVHYALLREDSVAPLRDAVAQVRDDPFMFDTPDVSIYEKVFIVGVTLARSGLALHIQFSTRRARKNIGWTYSNRLNPGTIVALTPKRDAFKKKCVVAVVACRLLEGVEKDPPEIDIFLASPSDIEIDPHFPFNEQICRLAQDIDTPEYINATPCMDFTALSEVSTLDITRKYDILERWPSDPMGKLDASQWSALNRMLTKKLAIIQGPPGTGKTFTSVAALKMMLSNKGPNNPPVIIAAQTNHALDQLIKHISVFEKNFVRLGGRTNDPEIRKRTTYEVRQNQGLLKIEGGLMTPMRKKQDKLAAEIGKLLEPLAPSNKNKPLEISLFLEHGLLSQKQVDSLQGIASKWRRNSPANTDPFRAWLAGSVREFDSKYHGNFGYSDDDIDLEYEQLKEIEVVHGRYEDDWSTFQTRFFPLSPGLRNASKATLSRAMVEKLLKEQDLCNISGKYRGDIYGWLREELIGILGEHLRDYAQTYQDCSANFQIGRFERDYYILQEASIIGMTTTGLSKYRGLVSSLNPRVILIEEAAEVLEAPIAVACLPSLQHLILVGDHLQLKGQCADHELCGHPFYLDVSMFERLMINKVPFAMLQEQRRMVPEIRKLVAPIYGDRLRDHPSVVDHPLVPGMGNKRSFFFDHTAHESSDSLSSKVNDFEASMVINFLAYLVMNKVPTASISVLTFYNGQKKLLMRKKSQNPNISHSYINILTVDSYQGEENDIILLSLVRSNDHRGIGFLQQDNRVCVALSRAKYGLYIFGNAQCVSEHSGFWYAVTEAMSENKEDPRIGPVLPLYCTRHNQETLIRTLKDWNSISDGCNKPCGKDLPCGHPCPRKCHGSEHDWVSCKQRCREIRECCNTTCICVCSPPHTHDCDCDVGKGTKTQVFDAKSNCDDLSDEVQRDQMTDPVTRAEAPSPDSDANEHAMRVGESLSGWQAFDERVRRWREFSQGGAMLDDIRRARLSRENPWKYDTPVEGNKPVKLNEPVKQNVPAPVAGGPVNLDHSRQARPPIRGKRPRKTDRPLKQKAPTPVEEDLIDFQDSHQAKLPIREKRLREADTTSVKQNFPAPVEGELISFEDCRQLLVKGKHLRNDTTSVEQNAAGPVEEDPIEQSAAGSVEGNLINIDEHRQAGLIAKGKCPQKDTTPVEQNAAARVEGDLIQHNAPGPIEGNLINFDDDDDCQAEGPRTVEDLPTTQTKEDVATYDGASDGLAEAMGVVVDTLTTPLEETLITFEDGDYCKAGDKSQQGDLLSATVENDDLLACSFGLVDHLLTSMVNEVLISPVEGDLIELS
ncbi:uncharacterized protein N7479_005408 [Penicillium vulpinum]|uniref:uncharacterized protein n=1 Tax=Penicillium vulpinum TaxID=29845 RepID=UPI0025492BFF|nr:uncharacterized protein N7479_005408 [Penicillium vulpinum]KAJ5958258.1 hypothetical protein N7479_005408 [Penicillium vulpinum]